MQLKISATLAAAVFAGAAIAQDAPNGRPPKATVPNGSAARNSERFLRFTGAQVQPGRVISKAEREHRKLERADSGFGGLDGQLDDRPKSDFEHNWAGFKSKLAANTNFIRGLEQLSLNIQENFAPGACTATVEDLRIRRRPYNLRSLIVLVIIFLLVFGALYTLVEYLLLASRASACSISTVYFPVPYTVTSGMPMLSSGTNSNGTAPTITHTSTMTHFSTLTEISTSYLTVQSAPSSAASPIATTGPSYFYTVNSAGSTDWAGGMSPSSGASLVILTTTVVMRPVPHTEVAVLSTDTETQTVTPPAYTSTVYSLSSPDLTSTSTSTHYVTYTVSSVNATSANITTTRTSFPGISGGGWNTSTSSNAMRAAEATMETADPISTTISSVRYYSTGPQVTSTSTTHITTTIASLLTVTMTPEGPSATGSPFVTTITALPITISQDSGGPLPSTGTAAVAPGSISLTMSSYEVSAQAETPSSSPTSSSFGTAVNSGYSAPWLPPPGSYGIYPNSSSSAGPTATGLNSHGTISKTLSATTSPLNATSPGVHKSATSTSISITNTFSAAALTAGPSGTSSSQNGSLSDTTIAPASIMSTMSNNRPFASPKFSAHNTTSAPTSGSLLSSQISAAALGTNSGVVGTATPSKSLNISYITSLPAYGTPYVSVASGFTKASASAIHPQAVSSGNSTLSTLATSVRPTITHTAGSGASTASSLVTNSTSISLTRGASTLATSSRPSLSASVQHSRNSSSHQPSSASAVSKTLSSSFSNPFPPSSATATPTGGCGEHGDFTIDFDDLPRFLPTNANNTDITQAPPIMNPYHHLTFSDGYVYAPEPNEPYQPVSPPHLAVFLANATGKTASSFDGSIKPGEIGDGPRDSIPAFWFDASSAFFGCDNLGPGACTLVFSAYKWNHGANQEMLYGTQNASIPACKDLKDMNCQLQKVNFPPSFRSLTGLQVQAFAGGQQRMFFMDNLALRWSNNSCAAGMLRQSSQ